MNTNLIAKLVVLGLVLVVLLGGCALGSVYMDVRNSSSGMENSIIAQVGVCATKIDSVYNTIATNYKVAQEGSAQIKSYLEIIFNPETSGEVQSTSATALVGAIAQFSVLGNTDLNELNLSVMNTVETGYAEWASCLGQLNRLQSNYATLLGRPIGAVRGQEGSFPNAWFADSLNLPHDLQVGAPRSPKHDLDGDGRLTVFDYPSVVVSSLTAGTFDTGELPVNPILATPAP